MNIFGRLVLLASLCLGSVGCASQSETREAAAKMTPSFSNDPLEHAESVTFVRRVSGLCPDAEGGQMWYAKVSGTSAVEVVYGIRFKGADDGSRHSLRLNPLYKREYRMFCTGDGVTLEWEPFLVQVEPYWGPR